MFKKLLLIIVFVGVGAWFFSSDEKTSSKTLPQLWQEALRGEYGAPEYEGVDKNKPLNEQTVIFEMADRTFEMPKVYIQSNLGKKRKITGINLVYVMPDFTSMGDFKNREEYKKVFNDRRMSSMSIQDDETKPTTIKQIMAIRKKSGKLTKYGGIEYDLEKYIDFDDPRHLNIHYPDTYMEKDEKGEVISYISCTSQKRKTRYPGCSHKFTDKGLRYSIAFNKAKYLPTWLEHREKAIKFIDSFEIKHIEKTGRVDMVMLSQAQRDALQTRLDNGDVSGFYSDLNNYGDPYGILGLGVTNNDTWQGQIANGFAESGAQDNIIACL